MGWPTATSKMWRLLEAESWSGPGTGAGFGAGALVSVAATSAEEATSAELRSDWTRESLAPWDFRVDSCAGVRALASLRWLTSVRIDLSVSLARTQRETSLKFSGAAVRPMVAAKTTIAVTSIIFVRFIPQVYQVGFGSDNRQNWGISHEGHKG